MDSRSWGGSNCRVALEMGKRKRRGLACSGRKKLETHPLHVFIQRSTRVNISANGNDEETNFSKQVLLDFKFDDLVMFWAFFSHNSNQVLGVRREMILGKPM